MNADQLIDTLVEKKLHWKKTSDGYKLSNGRFNLVKRGKEWFLVGPNKEIKMGRKATFDKAEVAIDTYFESIGS